MDDLKIDRDLPLYEQKYNQNIESKNETIIFQQNTNAVVDSNLSPYALMGCSFSKDDDKPSNFNATKNADLPPTKFYDDRGNLIKQNFGLHTIEYEYDENGAKTKETRVEIPDIDGDDCVVTTYFDETGKAIKRTWQSGIGTEKGKEFTGEINEVYDKETGLTIRTTKNNKSTVSIEYINNNGQIVKTILPNSITLDINYNVKHVKRICNYEYNEQGLRTKEITLPENDITIYEYNENNQLIKSLSKWSLRLGGSRQTHVINYEYNSMKQLIKVNHYDKGKFEGGLRISYDENGKEAERKYVFDDGTPYRIIKYKDGEIVSDREVNL